MTYKKQLQEFLKVFPKNTIDYSEKAEAIFYWFWDNRANLLDLTGKKSI